MTSFSLLLTLALVGIFGDRFYRWGHRDGQQDTADEAEVARLRAQDAAETDPLMAEYAAADLDRHVTDALRLIADSTFADDGCLNSDHQLGVHSPGRVIPMQRRGE